MTSKLKHSVQEMEKLVVGLRPFIRQAGDNAKRRFEEGGESIVYVYGLNARDQTAEK